MGRPRLRLVLAFSLVVLLAVAAFPGCSSAGQPEPGGAPAAGSVFRTNMSGEPDTIDPGRSNFAPSILVADQVFDGLFTYDKDLNLIPGVAKEVPTRENGGISADGTTYTMHLGASRWSDGQPVKAGDFVYAIKRTLDPALATQYATALYDIVGAEAYNTAFAGKEGAAKPSDAELSRLRDAVAVQAPDDSTVVVRIKAPRGTFTQVLALWVAWPVRQDVIAKYGDQWTEPPNYIGNGPWVLSKWEHGTSLEFVPNPHYTGSPAKVQKMVFVQLPDANQAFLAYKNGELEAVAVPDAAVKTTEADPALNKEGVRFTELTMFGFQYNTKQEPFSNLKVRQAISYAVDRKALVESVAQGVGKVAYSPVPPGMPGYDANAGAEFAFNPGRAKQLLAEAGYSDPSRFPRTQFTFADTSPNRLRAEFYQAQLKQNLGIDITLEPLDTKAYQQRYINNQFQIAFSGWGADYPDPDNIVPELFMTGSGNNHSSYSNPRVDQLSRDCRGLLNEQQRLAACAEAQKVVVADQPWTFAFYRERYWVVKPYVKGFQPTAKDQLPGSRFFSDITIAR